MEQEATQIQSHLAALIDFSLPAVQQWPVLVIPTQRQVQSAAWRLAGALLAYLSMLAAIFVGPWWHYWGKHAVQGWVNVAQSWWALRGFIVVHGAPSY